MQNQTREYNVWLLGLSGGRDLFDYCTALDLGDFKLGKDDNPVWVGKAKRIPRKKTAQKSSLEVQLFLTFQI